MKVSKGTVFQRNDSKYLRLNFSVDGKRRQVKTNLDRNVKKNWKIAKEELLPLFRAKILSGELVFDKEEVNKKTFEYYSDLYLNTAIKTLRESTYVVYLSHVRRWVSIFGKMNMSEIKVSDVKKAIYGIDAKNKVLKQYMISLRGIFNEAIDDNVINKNPCDRVKLGKDSSKEIFPFDPEEAVTLLENTSGWFQAYIAVCLYTGLRLGEVASLKWQNIDFKRKRIFVNSSYSIYSRIDTDTKTGKSRYVPIFDHLVEYLKEQERITGMKEFVFYGERDRLNNDTVRRKYWIPLLKRLRIPYRTPYQMRHTFATTLINSKKFTLNQVANMLGHANIKMVVETYNNFFEDEISSIDTSFNPFCNGFCYEDGKKPVFMVG